MSKIRIDVLLVERGLADSRSQAQRLVMAGQVRARGQVVFKASESFAPDTPLGVEQAPPFVSRGGEKLQAALQAFAIHPDGKICADVGASTGGFTDCLLQHDAGRVYAIDVGKGILHWKLRQDSRVVDMEGCNARYLGSLPEPVDLVTIDASFISLKLLLQVVKKWFYPADPATPSPTETGGAGTVVALIKPQFEAGRAQAARGEGVIRDPAIHRLVLQEVLAYAQGEGYGVKGVIRSPLLGPKGNTEFLAWLEFPSHGVCDLKGIIDPVFV